jgi:hypothetical protein
MQNLSLKLVLGPNLTPLGPAVMWLLDLWIIDSIGV